MKKTCLITILIITFICGNLFSIRLPIERVIFGKYDQYSLKVYEYTQKIQKTSQMVFAAEIAILPKTRIQYKFVMKTPESLKSLNVFDYGGEWKILRQGKQVVTTTSTRADTHYLQGKTYIISGSYITGKYGGEVRGIYGVKHLPLGNYKLSVYVNNVLVKKIPFQVVVPR